MDDKELWTTLLTEAVTKPGTISEAYNRFWNYSPLNQMLALWECRVRGIQPGPIASFMAWKRQGRWVKKGEHAIELCMPVTKKRMEKDKNGVETEGVFTLFIFKKNWFVLSQTDGPELPQPEPVPDWDKVRALEALGVTEEAFRDTDGNAQGYATRQSIAVNPLAVNVHKTTFHEVAHVLLGHTQEGICNDGERTPRTIREVEAEAVALICCESLGLPGADEARGYIQHWADGEKIGERSAQKIFKVAGQILKAGRPAETKSEQAE